MAKNVDGTSGYSNGPYEVPTGIDNGNDFSSIVTTAIKRLATHTHTNADSAQAALPTKLEQKFEKATLLFNVLGGLFTVTLIMTQITTVLKDLAYFYKLDAVADTPANWVRFYPTELHNINPNAVSITVNRDDIDIKVIG